MTEQRNKMALLFAACWKDEALKARLMSDPTAVLAERGINVPDGIDVKVVENSDNTVVITMPNQPIEETELSDDEMAAAAGGMMECCNMQTDSIQALTGCGLAPAGRTKP